jgi:hypothetical protein
MKGKTATLGIVFKEMSKFAKLISNSTILIDLAVHYIVSGAAGNQPYVPSTEDVHVSLPAVRG